MRLANDLYTIYGDLLIKKDREITAAVVNKIRQMGRRHKQVRVPLKNTGIFKDFEDVFDDKRYSIVFRKPVSKKEVCDIAGRLKIENDLIFELSNMKSNLPYTYRHVLILAAFVIKLSLSLKKNNYNEEIISHCGFTHDLGKTRIPIAILEKAKPLTKNEIAVIKTHPAIGYLLLNYYLKSDRIQCSLASLEHHEKLDGSGYPKGIKKISKYTQLISPVDIMDALMTKRPYRKADFSLRASLDYLVQEVRRGRLNEEIVLTLISYARKTKPDINSMKISKIIREKLPEELSHEKYG